MTTSDIFFALIAGYFGIKLLGLIIAPIAGPMYRMFSALYLFLGVIGLGITANSIATGSMSAMGGVVVLSAVVVVAIAVWLKGLEEERKYDDKL